MRNTAETRTLGRLAFDASRNRAAIEPLETRRFLAASIAVTDFSGGIVIGDGDNTPAVEEGTDFGVTPVGSGRPFSSFQVTNTSAADDLTLGGLSVPAGFQVEKALPDVLGPGSSAFFTIGLLDDAQEPRAGVVQFATNVPGAEVFDFAVSGAIVSAPPDPEKIFQDEPSFGDVDSVSFQGGTTPEGVPVSLVDNRLLRFNVPAGEAQVGFRIDATGGISDGATADVELLVIRDADQDGELDLAELAAPQTSFIAPTDAGEQSTQVTLPADTYFAFLRPANFTVTDTSVEQPGVRVDYVLNATVSAVVPPVISVTFGGAAAPADVPDDDTTPSPDEGTDFGAAQLGQPGTQRTYTLTNIGGGTLELGAATVTGPFQVISGLPASLSAGASTQLVVAMLTTAVGDLAGELSFATNAEGKNPYNFALAGSVTEAAPPALPEATVLLENGGSLANGQEIAVPFGSSVQGQAGAVRRFIVRNDGTAPLELGAVSVPDGFTLTEPLAPLLAPGESDAFTVTLSTATAGERTGLISFTTSDADENPFEFPVRGSVGQPGSSAEPDITVLLDGTTLASGQPVDFGTEMIGGASPERTVTLRNDGTGALAIGDVTLPGGFTLVQGPPETTLSPGESTTIRIGLSTAAAGTFAGEAAIASSDPDENPFALSLTGTVGDVAGPPARLAVSNVTGNVPAVVIAGDRRARGSIAFNVASNNGEAFAGPVTFSASASSDDRPGAAADVALVTVTKNVKLKAGATRTMRLKFKFPQTIAAGDTHVVVRATPVTVTPAIEPTAVGVGPAVSVQAPFVRLTGLPSATPAGKPLTFGKRATLAIPLQNVGNIPTSRAPATYTLIVSTDGSVEGQVFQTTATGRINLKPAATRAQKLSVAFPPGSFAAGSYTLIVRLTADPNETNGDAVALIPFTIS